MTELEVGGKLERCSIECQSLMRRERTEGITHVDTGSRVRICVESLQEEEALTLCIPMSIAPRKVSESPHIRFREALP